MGLDSLAALFYSQGENCYYLSCCRCGRRTTMSIAEYDSKQPIFLKCEDCRKKE